MSETWNHFSLTILGGGTKVRVCVHDPIGEPKYLVIPMSTVPELLRAFVKAEVGT